MAKKKVKKKVEENILKKLKTDSDGNWIFPLTKTFNYGKDRLVENLTLTEPKAKHLRVLSSEPNMDEILDICGDLAGEPSTLIDELCMKDAVLLTEFFGAFD